MAAPGHHGVVRKLVALAAAWLAAAAVAVAVAWQGVGIVANQVTDDRPAALAADEVQTLAEDADAPGAEASGPTTPAPAGETPVSGETAGGPPTAAPVDTLPPGATTATNPAAPGGTNPSAPATTTAPAAPTTTAPAAPAETRTYNVVGGSVSLRFSPSGVTVVWATPAAGFEVEVEPEHGNGVRVEFESDDHRSRVTGWWDGGPLDETREDER
jgi:hypothetical protein